MLNESYLIFFCIAALMAYIVHLIFKKLGLFNDYSDDYNYLPSNCYDTRYTNEAYAFFDSYLCSSSGMSTETFNVQLNEIVIEEIDCEDGVHGTTLESSIDIVPIIEEIDCEKSVYDTTLDFPIDIVPIIEEIDCEEIMHGTTPELTSDNLTIAEEINCEKCMHDTALDLPIDIASIIEEIDCENNVHGTTLESSIDIVPVIEKIGFQESVHFWTLELPIMSSIEEIDCQESMHRILELPISLASIIEEIDCEEGVHGTILEFPISIVPVIEEIDCQKDVHCTTLEFPISTVPIIETEEINIKVEAANNFDRIMPLAIEYNVPAEESSIHFVERSNNNEIEPNIITNNAGGKTVNDEIFNDINKRQSQVMEDVLELEKLVYDVPVSANDEPKRKKRRRFRRFIRQLFCFGCAKGATD